MARYYLLSPSMILLVVVKSNFNAWYIDDATLSDDVSTIRMEVASSRPDHLPTLSVAKTSKPSLLVKHHVLAIEETS